MSLLMKNSLPCERSRGLVFTERFENSAEVQKNGGTITDVEINDGVATFNGTSSYLKYNITFNKELSVIIKFTPNYTPSAGSGQPKMLFDSVTSRNLIYNSGLSGALSVYIGNTSIGSVPLASFINYWNTGEENIIILSAVSGNNNLWLNGNHVMVANSVTWTPSGDVVTHLGTDHALGATSFFDGEIKSVQMFNKALSAEEVLAYSNNTMFDYNKDAVLALTMLTRDHDATDSKTLDRSGNGNDFTIINDTKKLSDRGYYFPVGNGLYKTITSGDGLDLTGNQSYTIMFKVPALGVRRALIGKSVGSGSFDAGMIIETTITDKIYIRSSNGSLLFNNFFYDLVIKKGINITTMVFKAGEGYTAYLNGQSETLPTTLPNINSCIGFKFEIGKYPNYPGIYSESDFFQARIHNTALNETQVADLHYEMMQLMNEEG